MALIFEDSFQHFDVATGGLPPKWTAIGANMTSNALNSTIEMFGGDKAFHAAGNANGWMYKELGANYTTGIVGTYFRTGNVTAASTIFALADAGTLQIDVRYTSSGNITVTRNGTVLATSSNALSANTTYHIEFKTLIDDSSGTYEVRIDGSSTGWIPAASGADTKNTSNAYFNQVRLYSRNANDATTNHRFAHFYLLDTTGTVANDFLSPVVSFNMFPVGAGNHTDWTPNFASNWRNVSEPVLDNDVAFNQTSTASNKDSFIMDNVPSGTVYGVQACINVRQDSGSGHVVRLFLRIGGTNYYGDNQATGATYTVLRQIWTLNPATSAQWTTSDLNGLEAGYEFVS